MRAASIRGLSLGIALTALASASVRADPPDPKPPTTVTKPRPGGGTVTIIRTDVDGNGAYDKSVYEEKNAAGHVVRRVTEADANNDGKAETSTFEEYSDPTKAAPSTKETRTKDPADTGWRNVVTETDADQDGRTQEKKEATSTRADGTFDVVETSTDADDNGTVERVERKLAEPGGNDYTTTITTTIDNGTGEETGRTIKEGTFGPVEKNQTPVDMFTQPGEKGTGILRHSGTAVVDAGGGLGFTTSVTGFAGLSASDDPTLDDLLLADLTTPAFSRVADDFFVNQTGADIVIAQGGVPLLRGVVPELHGLGTTLGNGSLDPGSRSAFFGTFALNTLRLAGVAADSPFFDAAMTGIASAFILDLARLLDPRSPDYVPFGGLLFRFDAIDDLATGGGGASWGRGTLRVEAVPEPAVLVVFGLGLLAVAAKLRKRESSALGGGGR